MDNPDTLNRRARLRELIEHCFENNQAALLKHIEARTGRPHNQGEMSAIQRDHGGKSFGDKKAQALANSIGLSRYWFDLPLGSNLDRDKWLDAAPLDARGNALPPQHNAKRVPDVAHSLAYSGAAMPNMNTAKEPERDLHGGHVIKQYDAGGRMGATGLVLPDQPGVIQSWEVSPDWLRKNVRHFSATRNLCIVTGFGDSMRPMFNPGDPLLVDTGVTKVDADGVYFFRVGDEGFIKRIQRIPGVGYVVKSSNPEYDPWTIKDATDFAVIGRVIKVWKSDDT